MTALLPHGQQSPSLNKEASSWSKESIAHLHNRDDAEVWKGWKRHLFRLVPLLTFANTGLYLAYLALRIACVVWAQHSMNSTFPQAWVFIAIEVAVAIPAQMHNIWTMWSMKKRQRPKLRLMGNDVPTVDVFITCCGEDDEVVMDTVRAACDVDYPMDRFRVIVLDDAKSTSLEQAVTGLAMMYPNTYYMARTKIPGQPHHFKAGNLNFGLEQTTQLPGGAGQFMAALDADMVGCNRNPIITQSKLICYRFLNAAGFALCSPIYSPTPRWHSPALPSSSTTPLPLTLSPKVWTCLCTSLSLLRML